MSNALMGSTAPYVVSGGGVASPDPAPLQNLDGQPTGPNPQRTPTVPVFGASFLVEDDGTTIVAPTPTGETIIGEEE